MGLGGPCCLFHGSSYLLRAVSTVLEDGGEKIQNLETLLNSVTRKVTNTQQLSVQFIRQTVPQLCKYPACHSRVQEEL